MEASPRKHLIPRTLKSQCPTLRYLSPRLEPVAALESTLEPKVVGIRGVWDLSYSSFFLWWGSPSSSRFSMACDIGWHFTLEHSTVGRTCITTSGRDSAPTSVRQP
jgi:hypothetical protein